MPPRVGPGIPDPRCPIGSSIKNPVQLPHHSDCNRFYKCDHGLAFEYRCPTGQHWSTSRNWCDFPNLAGCSTNEIVQLPVEIPTDPITIPMAPPVSSPQVAGIPDPRCPHIPTPESQVGAKNLKHLSNCNKYLKCNQGLAFEHNCPTGQHWNTARDYCDMPQSANCQVDQM